MNPRLYLRLLRKPEPKPEVNMANVSPLILERLTHTRWPAFPTDYANGVQERWEAMKAAYAANRNRAQAQALSRAVGGQT